MTRENIDSREGFSNDEYLAYIEQHRAEIEAELPTEEDYEEMAAMFAAMDERDEAPYGWDMIEGDDEYERDLMLEQQEREDFCECDESYGYYGDSEW